MPLPQKRWFRVAEVAKRWDVPPADIEDYALDELIELSVLVADVPAEAGWWETGGDGEFKVPHEQIVLNGPQPLLRSSLLEIFRNGQAQVITFRTCPAGSYLCVRSDASPVVVRREDLIVTRAERDRFERAHALADGASDRASMEFAHSDDFTRVRIGCEWHSFGPRQAAILRLLKSAGEGDNPWCEGKTLLAKSGAATMRLIDLFKRKPVWRQLVIADGKGCYRLNAELLSSERRRVRLFRRAAKLLSGAQANG